MMREWWMREIIIDEYTKSTLNVTLLFVDTKFVCVWTSVDRWQH